MQGYCAFPGFCATEDSGCRDGIEGVYSTTFGLEFGNGDIIH